MSNVTYNNTERLRFWCQKVLPIVYDDSLSYYELLNKVVVYLNSTIEDVQAMIEDVTRIEQGFNSKIDVSQKGVANGVATLDGNGEVPLSQLPDISAGVQTISVNGVNVPADANKNVNIIVMTNAVSDLVNYYLKSETYNKTEVNTLIDNVKNSRFEVVTQLPTSDIQTNVIYLVAKSVGQTQNGYDEFINLDGTTSGWELIGSTDIDLSGYVTDSELNTALSAYVTTQSLNTTLASYVTNGALTSALEGYVTNNTFASLVNTVNGKADEFDVDGFTINWLEGVGVPNTLYVMEHNEISQEGIDTSGLPNDEAVRKAVKSAYDLMEDTVGWTGKNLFNGVATSETSQGVTWTVDANDNNIVTISGTPTGFKAFTIDSKKVLSVGEYVLSGISDTVNVVYNGVFLYKNNALVRDLNIKDNNKENTFSILQSDDYDTIRVQLKRAENSVACSGTGKIMIRKADILDGTYEPYRGTTAFPRDEQAIVGANNLMPSTIYELNTASAEVGDSTFTTYTGVQSFVAPIKRNTTYTLSRATGNRFRVALSTSFPANGVACKVLINDDINEYTFNSSNYDYVFVMMNAGSETYDNIKPVLNIGSVARPFVPYAMTNRELTENKVENSVVAPVENGSIASKAYGIGEHFIKNGTLAVAIQAIASGETFTLNTNYREGKVGGLLTPVIISVAIDLDTLLASGIYYLVSAPTHGPESISSFYLWNMCVSTSTQIQIAMRGSGENVYIRTKTGGNWNNWFKFTGTELS